MLNTWETNNAAIPDPRFGLRPCEYVVDGVHQPVIANHHGANNGTGTSTDAASDQL
jgi:hypothetical protein